MDCILQRSSPRGWRANNQEPPAIPDGFFLLGLPGFMRVKTAVHWMHEKAILCTALFLPMFPAGARTLTRRLYYRNHVYLSV